MAIRGSSPSPTQFTSIAPGIVPASGGGSTKYLRADQTWDVPPSGSGSVTNVSGTAPVTVTNPTTTPVVAVSVATSTASGLVPTPPNSTTEFLRGDATWAVPSGSGPAGFQLLAQPSVGIQTSATSSTGAVGNVAYQIPINITSQMYVESLGVQVQSANSGTVQWGLFDYSGSASAATELVGGSGSLNSNYSKIQATSGPVLVQPGCYVLIVAFPGTNSPSVYRTTQQVGSVPGQKYYVTYTWTTTPNLTSASWVTDSVCINVFLQGALNSSTPW